MAIEDSFDVCIPANGLCIQSIPMSHVDLDRERSWCNNHHGSQRPSNGEAWHSIARHRDSSQAALFEIKSLCAPLNKSERLYPWLYLDCRKGRFFFYTYTLILTT